MTFFDKNTSHFQSLLDGNGTNTGQGQGGKITPPEHICSWDCNSLPNNDLCKSYENYLYETLKQGAINRAKNYIMTTHEVNKDNAYDWDEAYQTLRKEGYFAPKPKKHAGHELGAREFTLTYSPKWCDDAEARKLFTRAMDRLYKYYEGSILQLRAVGEVGTNGLSHIHCFYKLEGGLKITDKNFKRAWKYWNPSKKLGWGFEGGHHACVKNEADFLGYIDKDVDTAWYDTSLPASLDPKENPV